MPTYAGAELLRAYCAASGVVLPATAAELDALIERAERDIDRLLGPYPIDPLTGLKLDPLEVTPAQAGALARATCAAAEYRVAVGEDAWIEARDGLTAVGGLSFDLRPLPRVAPKALEELSGHALLLRSGCALADPLEVDASL